MTTLPYRSSGRTETGKIRRHNEDAILLRDDIGLWVVADGLGGHSAGDYASGQVVERLAALPRPDDVCDFIESIEDTLARLNTDLLRVASERNVDLIGSTVVMLVHDRDFMLYGWIGDSRGYCFDTARLRQVTRDHVHGVKDDVTQFNRDNASFSTPPGTLTRAVGAQESLFVDWAVVDHRPGMKFMLCSDGITKEIDDDELGIECGRGQDPQSLVARLFELAMSRSARDNISAVAVHLQE